MRLYCQERDDLERLIRDCVSCLQASANQGVQIARVAGTEPLATQVFNDIRNKSSYETGRLMGLRDALEIHRRIHGC